MKDSTKELGKALKGKINKGCNIEKISNWAYILSYINHRKSFSPEIMRILNDLSFMDAGPEFEFSAEQLNEIADRLIFDGEKEELSEPIPEIKIIAEDLGDNWLLCPLCQEAWQFQTKYGMVLCPKCDNKLHNPKFQSSLSL
jgi:hypothetical protein